MSEVEKVTYESEDVTLFWRSDINRSALTTDEFSVNFEEVRVVESFVFFFLDGVNVATAGIDRVSSELLDRLERIEKLQEASMA